MMTQDQHTLSSLDNTFSLHSLHSLIKPVMQLQSRHISFKNLKISNKPFLCYSDRKNKVIKSKFSTKAECSAGLESLTKVPCVSPRLISLNYCSIYQQYDHYDTQHFNNTHFY